MTELLAPERRRVHIPLTDVEWRKSRDGQSMTVAGHAAVFNRLSHDLGGFREKINSDAFNAVLDRNPDVHLLWDHDTSLVLARTTNKTLDLRIDPHGLHYWARVAPTSYAKDLQILMERGDIDQASFAFTVEEDDWMIDSEENITRTIRTVGELFDVTITAKGAYPQTDSSLRSLLTDAIAQGRLPDLSAGRTLDLAAPETVAEEEHDSPEDEEERILDVLAELEETLAAPDEEPVAEEPTTPDLIADLKSRSRATRNAANESIVRLLKEHGLT